MPSQGRRRLDRGRTGWLVAAAVASVLVLSGCGDDDTAPDSGDATSEDSAPVVDLPTTVAPETGGIEVPEMANTYPVAIPSLHFGVAVPVGWQATVLSDEALDKVANADLATPSFLTAARAVAETGAVFYAAGVDTMGRVAELKVDVQTATAGEDDDGAAWALRTAEAVVASGALGPEAAIDGATDGWARIDYRTEGTAAEDGTAIDVHGTQLFTVVGPRLFSLIVTGEDGDLHRQLVELFQAAFVGVED